MTLDACAALVQRGDPDRWAALMAMPVTARARLLPLYAYNLEIARAPWVTAEPVIAEMRLQWWRDVVANAASGAARAHDVAGPLHDLIRDHGLDVGALDAMAAARRHDAWGEPFEDQGALWAFLGDTGGNLMWVSTQALGAGAAARDVARDLGTAAALAAYLAALPDLAARGRTGLPDPSPAAIRGLAQRGLDLLSRSVADRRVLGPGAVAGLSAWLARPLLRRALADPAAVPAVPLAVPEVTRRGRLLWVGLTGRW